VGGADSNFKHESKIKEIILKIKQI